ncbi:Uncharacterized protein Fot_02524 [Forsythia ovata]|uniref:Uncharacterized protein n=1 Tax=Forsythia ovata TaxID=205694 RepID=A0ABD1X7Y6_9LAMI
MLVQIAPIEGKIALANWCKLHQLFGANFTSNWCILHQLCGANLAGNWCKMHQLVASANCTSRRQNCTSNPVQIAPAMLVHISPATGAPVMWCTMHHQTGAKCTSHISPPTGANYTSYLVQNAPTSGAKCTSKIHQQLVQSLQFLHQFYRTKCPQFCTRFTPILQPQHRPHPRPRASHLEVD